MTTPDGRDARSGEDLDAADPSVGGDATVSGPSASEHMPRTPDRDAASTEEAPRADEQDEPADTE